MEQLGGYRSLNYKSKQCSPISKSKKKSKQSKQSKWKRRNAETVNGSCLDAELIMKIAKGLNKLIRRGQIKKDVQKINLKSPIQIIHGNICKILTNLTGCSSESCWMNMDKLMGLLGKKDKLQFKESFKPIMPKKWVNDYNTWLRTDDIEKCLDQHDKSDDHFYFYGAVPIDFNKCSVSDLCSFNLKKHISNGIRKIGIVFNTDPHNEPGEHWISAYIDIYGDNLNKIPGLYYYDSYGEGPPKEVKDLFQKIKKQGNNLNKKFKVFYNDYSHQNLNYQCGMYAIHFIKQMINGMHFKEFVDSNLTDDKMSKKRDVYFIHPKELKYKHYL